MISLWPFFLILGVAVIAAIFIKFCKDLHAFNQKNRYQNIDSQREVRIIRKGKMRHPDTEEILDCVLFKRNDEEGDTIYVTEKEDFHERYQHVDELETTESEI